MNEDSRKNSVVHLHRENSGLLDPLLVMPEPSTSRAVENERRLWCAVLTETLSDLELVHQRSFQRKLKHQDAVREAVLFFEFDATPAPIGSLRWITDNLGIRYGYLTQKLRPKLHTARVALAALEEASGAAVMPLYVVNGTKRDRPKRFSTARIENFLHAVERSRNRFEAADRLGIKPNSVSSLAAELRRGGVPVKKFPSARGAR